jgi:esterase
MQWFSLLISVISLRQGPLSCLYTRYYPSPQTTRTPLVILHGFLGSSDNWHSLARRLGVSMTVHTLDARNHGHSPHSEEFTYELMAEDVRKFLRDRGLKCVNLLGHSMGGKTAMLVALSTPELVEKLIVVDIAPRQYDPRHDELFQVLSTLDIARFSRRAEIMEAVSRYITNPSTVQFVLKNLKRGDDGSYRWKVNLPVLLRSAAELNCAIGGIPFTKPALFIRGEKSDYIVESDREEILSLFPGARIETIPNAGHLVQVDAPLEFAAVVTEFLV